MVCFLNPPWELVTNTCEPALYATSLLLHGLVCKACLQIPWSSAEAMLSLLASPVPSIVHSQVNIHCVKT